MDEAELVRCYAPRVRLYGLRHLRSAPAADDLVQAVMLILLEAVREGRVREPAAFVLGTARHVVAGWRRGEARRTGLLDRFGPELEPAAAAAPAIDREQLARCLGGLPPREQLVVTLTFYEDQGADEIATRLGMTTGNVRVVRHRALAHLAECLS